MNISQPPPVSYSSLLDYLNAKQEARIVLGLDRVREFLGKLGNPQNDLRVIHVAGTNAKGSVCAMLFSVLKAAGYNAGLYTSPHFEKINERIKTREGVISDNDWEELGAQLREISGHEELTYFEFLTVLAFVYFKRKNINPVVLETGLGGRLDATNVVENPLVSVIASIGLDHCQWLGSTLPAVAWEKAGIVKRGVPVAVGPMADEAFEVIKNQADRLGSRLVKTDLSRLESQALWLEGRQRVDLAGQNFYLRLLGKAQASNAALTVETVHLLRRRGLSISDQALNDGFAKVDWLCRWQVIMKEFNVPSSKSQVIPARNSQSIWILDVAHNPQAVMHFLETLALSPWSGFSKRAIIGFMKDKDYKVMIDLLIPYFDEFYCCGLEPPRGLGERDAALVLKNKTTKKFLEFESVAEAMAMAMADTKIKVNAVLGSFKIAAPALRHLT